MIGVSNIVATKSDIINNKEKCQILGTLNGHKCRHVFERIPVLTTAKMRQNKEIPRSTNTEISRDNYGDDSSF